MEQLNLLIDMIKDLHKDVDKIDSKIAEIREEQISQSFHISKNTSDLEYHIKRTDLLEDDVKILERDTDDRLDELEEDKKFKRKFIVDSAKVMGMASALLGIVLGLYKFKELL